MLSEYRKNIVKTITDDIELCIEEAIKEIILPHLKVIEDVLDEREINYKNKNEKNFEQLIKDKNFESKCNLISKHKAFLEPAEQEKWSDSLSELLIIREIRNHLSHVRKITDEHQEISIKFCRNQIRNKSIVFSNLAKTLSKIDIQDFVDLNNSILCNFPDPDYIVHRFFGRSDLFKKAVKGLSEQKWPVTNIYSQGGLGKTAFVDHLARYLADQKKFEKIIWFSDKRETFDLQKSSSVAVTQKQSLQEFARRPIDGSDKNFDEIIKDNKCLIIFDNLETIFEEGVKFIERYASYKTQFISTSRIESGIGNQLRLGPLEVYEGVALIESMNSYLSIEEIDELEPTEIEQLVSRLNCSPLLIKWSLIQLQRGMQLESLFNRKKNILDFCFSGLIEKLSDNAKSVLNLLYLYSESIPILQIQLLLNFNLEDIEDIISELRRSALIQISKNQGIKSFSINESIKPLLVDRDLADLKDTLILKNEIKKMNKNLSRLRLEKHENIQYFYNDSAIEINSDMDALVAWKLDDIHFEYKRNKSFLSKDSELYYEKYKDHPLELQNKRFKNLNQVCQNNPDILIAAGIAYSYADENILSERYLIQGYQLASSEFQKKKSLYFLCTVLDKNRQYLEMIDYANKLYSLDQGFKASMILSSTYFGLKKYSKALEILDKSIDTLLSSDDQREIAKSIMQFFKTIKKSLSDPTEKSHEHFEQIYETLYASTIKFIPHYDAISLDALYAVISRFRYSYTEFINFSLESERLDSETLLNNLKSKIVDDPDRKKMYEVVSSWDLAPGKKIKSTNFKQTIIKENITKNLNSQILNESYKNKNFIKAIVKNENLSKNMQFMGWMLTIEEDNAHVFLPKYNVNDESVITIGMPLMVRATNKSKNNWVVSTKEYDINQQHREKNILSDPRKKYKVNDQHLCKIVNISENYFLAEIIDSGEEHTGMLHKKNDNSFRALKLTNYTNRYAIGDEVNLNILDISDDKKIQFFIP